MCRAMIPDQHDVALGGASERAGGAERLSVVGVDAVPAQHSLEVAGERPLNEPILAVDAGDHASAECRSQVGYRSKGTVKIEGLEIG